MFEVKFGINQGNLEPLHAAVTYAAANSDTVVAKGDNGFGEVYLLDFALTTDTRSGTVRTVWIVRHGEDFPRLTTCYVL